MIGTVGHEAKADTARRNGCDHVIVAGTEDLAARVKDITGGKGIRTVFDSVGADSIASSLDNLAPRGTLARFGESSVPLPPLTVASPGARGSVFLTWPSIVHYTADRADYEAAAGRVFAALAPPQVTTYPPGQAARAQDDMENRRTLGSVVLLP